MEAPREVAGGGGSLSAQGRVAALQAPCPAAAPGSPPRGACHSGGAGPGREGPGRGCPRQPCGHEGLGSPRVRGVGTASAGTRGPGG